MDRRAFVETISLGLLVTPRTAQAQPAKLSRIGFLGGGSPTPETWKYIEPFRRGLRDHGYVEGQNILVEYRGRGTVRALGGPRRRVMDRRAFLETIPLALLVTPLATDAQQAGKVYRIGVLAVGDSPAWESFRQALRQLGYVEGSNTAIEWRWSEGRLERFPDFAAELVSLKVDVIVASTYPGTLAAKNATGTTPIIMVAVADPVRMGLIASLVRPGGNITGLTLLAGMEIVGKHLELLKETVPNLSRVAVLRNPANPMHVLRLREVEVAGRSLAMQLQILEAQGPKEFDSAFAAMTRERAGGLYVVGDPVFIQHRTRLAELAARHHLPAVYELKEHAEAGGLMAYGPRTLDTYRRAATYVDKILKGARPADLPVEQPTRFELVINLKTAKALGLTIPPSVRARADEVIE